MACGFMDMQQDLLKVEEELVQLERDVARSLDDARVELWAGLPRLVVGDTRPEEGGRKLAWHWQDRVAQVLEDYVTGLWKITDLHGFESAWDWIENRVRSVFHLMVEEPGNVLFGTGMGYSEETQYKLRNGVFNDEPQNSASLGPADSDESAYEETRRGGSSDEPQNFASLGPADSDESAYEEARRGGFGDEPQIFASLGPADSIESAYYEPARAEWLPGELAIVYEDCQLRITVTFSAQLRFLENRAIERVQQEVRQKLEILKGALENVAPSHWIFHKETGGWSIGFSDRPATFPDLLGMTYLRELLRYPEREFPVEDLVALGRNVPGIVLGTQDLAIAGLVGQENRQEILDNRAIQQLRHRLAELKRDAEIASHTHNTSRLAEIREEQEFLEDEVRRNMALGGQHRTFARISDNQRVSVRKATLKALERITQRIPEIGEHLQASIRFGSKCSYRPLQKRDWRF